MAIRKDKQEHIEDDIKKGYTQDVIAKKYKVSTRTVLRLKKRLVQANPQLAEQISDNKYSLKIGDRQAAQAAHLKELKRLYEDTEEGWVYDVAEEEYKSRQTSRTFAGIVYGLTDETRLELAEKLEAKGYGGQISPIHDKDLWTHDSPSVVDEETGEILEEEGSRYKAGDRKKPHVHVMVQLDTNITKRMFNGMIHSVLPDTPLWIIVTTVKGYHNYLTHHTEAAMKAGKYLYEEDEIITFGNFEMIMTKKDKQLIISMIAAEIMEEHICYLNELVKRHLHVPEEIGIIKDCSYFFKGMIDEQWKKANPNGRVSRNEVLIVKEFNDTKKNENKEN